MQIGELRDRLGGLPSPDEAQDIWRGIWLEEAHHSTAIEGNTLVLNQVEKLLAEGRAVGNKELGEYMEVRGYASAADWVYTHALRPESWSSAGPIRATAACWRELLARAVLDNLYKFIVPAVAGPARLVPLPVLASDDLSMNALRMAAARGRLKAQKAADGTWRSSQLWVDEYRASRHARGRGPVSW